MEAPGGYGVAEVADNFFEIIWVEKEEHWSVWASGEMKVEVNNRNNPNYEVDDIVFLHDKVITVFSFWHQAQQAFPLSENKDKSIN